MAAGQVATDAAHRRLGASLRESGSAPVEFVYVAGICTLLFLGVVQLALSLHVRNTLVACAQEGARYAANADIAVGPDPAAGAVAAARRCITTALPDDYANDVTAQALDLGGVPVVEVTVRATLPLAGPWGPHSLTVRGHALLEPR